MKETRWRQPWTNIEMNYIIISFIKKHVILSCLWIHKEKNWRMPWKFVLICF